MKRALVKTGSRHYGGTVEISQVAVTFQWAVQ